MLVVVLVAGEGEAVLAAAVDGHLLDEHVLDALQEGGRAHRVCAAHPQPPASPVPGGVYLTCTKALHFPPGLILSSNQSTRHILLLQRSYLIILLVCRAYSLIIL